MYVCIYIYICIYIRPHTICRLCARAILLCTACNDLAIDILHCTILHYTILYNTTLYCTILYYTILCATILYDTILAIIYYATFSWATRERERARRHESEPGKGTYVQGFHSSRFLVLRGGPPTSVGPFPGDFESTNLSTGLVFAGRLGVVDSSPRRRRSRSRSRSRQRVESRAESRAQLEEGALTLNPEAPEP